jgi:hypothetical protein
MSFFAWWFSSSSGSEAAAAAAEPVGRDNTAGIQGLPLRPSVVPPGAAEQAISGVDLA